MGCCAMPPKNAIRQHHTFAFQYQSKLADKNNSNQPATRQKGRAMSQIRIVTDSGSDISPEAAAEHQVAVVPLKVRFGTEEYTDHQDITVEQFYEKMQDSAELPATAAPSQGTFEETFRSLAAEGATDIICVNMSYKLSATGQAAVGAAGAVADAVNVHTLDSNMVSVGLGNIAIEAAKAAAAGRTLEEVKSLAEDLIARTKLFGVLNTLENLARGGRIGRARAMLGSALSIKPIVEVADGEVEEAAKPRTRRRAFLWIRDQMLRDREEAGGISHLAVGHGIADDFEDFCALLSEEFDTSEMLTGMVGPIIGTHAGPGIIGMSYATGGPSEFAVSRA